MSYSDLDLVLDGIDNPDDLVGEVESWYDMEINRKIQRASAWAQSLHFYAGDQWITYNASTRRWQSIPYTSNQRNLDRPVTNHYLMWIIINTAGFSTRPKFIIDPNTQDPRDKTAARASRVISSFMWEDQDKDDSYYEAALWLTLCGTVFRKSYKKRIPKHLIDDGGRVLHLNMPDHEIVSPFRISVDGLAKRWRDIGLLMDYSPRRLEYLKLMYGVDEEGYTGQVNEVKQEKHLNNVLSLEEGLKNILEGGSYQNQGVRSGGAELKNSAVEKIVFTRPTGKYPQGRMMVVCAGKLLYDSGLRRDKKNPYFYQGGKFWHPYTYCQYMRQPGSLWGLSLGQQLIPIQRRINSIDALLAYNRKTVATGTWLIPSGSNVPDEQFIGIPGQNVTYDPQPGGDKPHKEAGTPLPNQVVEERHILLTDGNRIAFAADLQGGQNPQGVKTVGQLQILREESEDSRSKQVERWEKFVEKSEQIDLLNFQDCYRVPLPEFYKEFKRLSKDFTDQDWETFLGSDLRENSAIRVERGSSVRKSRIMRQQTILRLAQLGLLGEIVGDPLIHKKFLEEFGLSNLFTDDNVDMKMAEFAIEKMLDGEYPPVLEGVHNPDIQLIILVHHMKDPKYLEYPKDVQRLFERRKMEYIDMLAAYPLQPDGEEIGEGGKAQGGEGGGGSSASSKAANMLQDVI